MRWRGWHYWVLFMIIEGRWMDTACSVFGLVVDDEPCCDSWTKNGWYELGHEDLEKPITVCSNSQTSSTNLTKGQTILINFQPANSQGLIGIATCKDEASDECYIADIFGLFSGRLGYLWRQVPDTKSDDKRWVPGKSETQPSHLIQGENWSHKGVWDQDGKTIYQIYVERTLDGTFRIRLNGGDAQTQDEMSFQVPEEYSRVTVGSFYGDSKIFVQGATGCSKYQRFDFKPGQELRVSWLRPFGALGLSLCTDSAQADCYILDIFCFYQQKLCYHLRHSQANEDGPKGWVPGREDKVPGEIIKRGDNAKGFQEKLAYDRKPLVLVMRRTLSGELIVGVTGGHEDQAAELVFDIPSNFQFGTIGNYAILFGVILNHGHARVLGPCYNGESLGYLSPTCKHQLPLTDISAKESNGLWSPKPGLTKAEMRSPVLNIGSSRSQLCVSLVGIANQGGRISVSAVDASGNSETSVHVGDLSYNGVNPPEWQHIRLTVELPAALQNVPLKLVLTSDRKKVDSLVLLKQVGLCAYDGCGLPSADGVPNIAYGERVSLVKYPWHVAIFRKDGAEFKNICGGSLIRPDVVISAAHCFHDHMDRRLENSRYFFTVGKTIRDFFYFESGQQGSPALDIHIPERYIGQGGNYIYDIAVIRVQFNISSVLLPVCFDWTARNLPSLMDGDVGEVAGWGVTESETTSRDLLFGSFPYASYEKCKAAVPDTFWRYLSTDKFCAGNIGGQTVRKGDSGGGFVTKTGGLYYLRGIVSTGVPGGALTYSTFTDVSKFTDWMKETLKISDT